MQASVSRKLFLGFIQIHMLHHAKKEPFYGSWMMEELEEHGYTISAGTLYPILHTMENTGLLTIENKTFAGKVRKYYSITSDGILVLEEAKEKLKELVDEIM